MFWTASCAIALCGVHICRETDLPNTDHAFQRSPSRITQVGTTMANTVLFADLEHKKQTDKNQENLPQPKVKYRVASLRVREAVTEGFTS